MAKGKKAGPPYTNRSSEYAVVAKPWGMASSSRDRGDNDVNRLGTWVHIVLQDKGVNAMPESVFMMGTRDEVIVQLPLGTNIRPLLGEHRWATFWKGHTNDAGSSYVFEYNYQNNGDPANHSWAEYYPQNLGPGAPVTIPYPEPRWVQPITTIKNLVLPIPIPPRPVEKPTPESVPTTPPVPEPVATLPQSPEPAALFKPYVPPTHHPAHTRYPDAPSAHAQPEEHGLAANDPDVKAEEAVPKYIRKLDPYEQEEEAKLLLQTKIEVKEEQIPTLTMKLEAKDEPSDEELSADPNDSGEAPSSELTDAFNEFMRRQGLVPSTNQASSVQDQSQRIVKPKREISEIDVNEVIGVKKIKLENV
ncbi:hypothetical protein BV22DRAFT_1029344 [Leucogyrophana mollusca]|uniref:Uncharacterized protein n=1 Tax=Leucogyrophana mollusca TaxID=85980 RepID=A0ACB8BWR2_9AGAM|nr:hypothetical protein BV22DRAFT_1029344 [Leucogyrophana mollusca]